MKLLVSRKDGEVGHGHSKCLGVQMRWVQQQSRGGVGRSWTRERPKDMSTWGALLVSLSSPLSLEAESHGEQRRSQGRGEQPPVGSLAAGLQGSQRHKNTCEWVTQTLGPLAQSSKCFAPRIPQWRSSSLSLLGRGVSLHLALLPEVLCTNS